MSADFIGRHIARTNRALLVSNILVVAALVAFVGVFHRYAYSFYRGPLPIGNQELVAITDPDEASRSFVHVDGQDVAPLGVSDIEQTISKSTNQVISEKTTAEFVVLAVGGRALLVRSPPGKMERSYSGALTSISYGLKEDMERFAESKPSLGPFLPFMLDAEGYREPGYWALAIGLPIIAIVIWNLSTLTKRRTDPLQHPILARLAAYGDPAELRSAIDADSRLPQETFGKLSIGQRWIYVKSMYGLELMPLEDVVWSYTKVTKKSVNFIPTGKTYSILIWSRIGRAIDHDLSKRKVEEVLDSLMRRVPWAAFGYSEDLQGAWSKNRNGFLQEIQTRRGATGYT